MERSGILSSDCAPEERFVEDYTKLKDIVEAIRKLGGKIVLTSGSFDLAHIGHARYLREARLRGDFLVVGVESDERIQIRKGPNRPIVPQHERIEALTHLRYVDMVTLKHKGDESWMLIKTVRPDVLVISERTGYSGEKVERLREFCGEVVNLPSQAETSTSARLREMQIGVLGPAIESMEGAVEVLAAGLTRLRGMKGG
ncbi:MAG: adenylyltransferase/cytidyltransferase family protein [Candidatus Pacebacteria bacterium]|nr:adenylyltransferase/cytidyltransferase family protein [Candidatus Paceibacterota bacterium]